MLLFYKTYPNLHAILAKIKAKKQEISRYFTTYALLHMSIFKKSTCILHHLAFLDRLNVRNFSSPITRIQLLKSHFLMVILPFWAMCFMVLKGLFILFAVYFYAYYLPFSRILPCVLHHFTLRFAPKRTAFSTKTHCILRHIALHLAPKCTAFSSKQPKNWCKWQSSQINIHFANMYNQPPFCIITNLRENRFFAACWAVGEFRRHSQC